MNTIVFLLNSSDRTVEQKQTVDTVVDRIGLEPDASTSALSSPA